MPNAKAIEGALTLLREARLRAMSALNPAKTEAVGDLFRDMYSMPGAYERGQGFRPDLAQQFGTRPVEESGVYGYSPADYRISTLDDKNSLWATRYNHAQAMKRALNVPSYEEALRAGYMKPGREFFDFDTGGLHRKSGEGQALYAHAYGDLAWRPDAYNIMGYPTEVNKARRSLNMASAIGRDPRLADRIIPHPEQLPVYTTGALGQYSRLRPDQKLGALQMMHAVKMNQSLGAELIKRNQRAALGSDPDPLAYSILMALEPGAPRSAATALSDTYRQGLHRTEDNFTLPLGDRTARKLMLTDQALQGRRPPWGDLQEWATNLEFRAGGPVR